MQYASRSWADANLCWIKAWLSTLNIIACVRKIKDNNMVEDEAMETRIDDTLIPLPNDSNDGFMTALLKNIAEKAQLAKLRGTCLVILIFAPVTPDQDICVDFGASGEAKTYLRVEAIRETIRRAVGGGHLPVTLVTPSPFTGGWSCRPTLLGQGACPSGDHMMRLIAKSCGGAVANQSMRYFTERNTPLLTEAQRQKTKYNDLMPIGPTELQTRLLHRLQRQIHESMERRFSVLAHEHGFILQPGAAKDPSSFTDSWTSYAPRHGRPLNSWAKLWRLPQVVDLDRFEFLGGAFGGSKATQIFHLKYLSAIELDTCPGDWKRNVNGITRDLLTSFLLTANPEEDTVKRVFDAIEFRASSMILAQILARALNLPWPDGLKCRYWHDWIDVADNNMYSRLQTAFKEAHNLFDQAAVFPSENPHEFKAVRFHRAARWLCAAIASKFSDDHSREEIEKFVLRDVAQLVEKIRDTQRVLLLEDQAVKSAGLRWIAGLGLSEKQYPDEPVPSVSPKSPATTAFSNHVISLSKQVPPGYAHCSYGGAVVLPGIINVQNPANCAAGDGYWNDKEVKPATRNLNGSPQGDERKHTAENVPSVIDTSTARAKEFHRKAARHNIRTAPADAEQRMMGGYNGWVPWTSSAAPRQEYGEATSKLEVTQPKEQVQQAKQETTENFGEVKMEVDEAEERPAPGTYGAAPYGREDPETAHQPVVSSTTTSVSPSQHNTIANVLSNSLGSLLTGNPEVDAVNIAQVLAKAVELVSLERTKKTPAESSLAPVTPTNRPLAAGGVLDSSRWSGESAAASGFLARSDVASTGGEAFFEAVTGPSPVNSFRTPSDSTTPCTPGAAGLPENLPLVAQKNEPQAVVDGGAGATGSSGNPDRGALVYGEDFFARAQIPWFRRS